MAELVTVAGVAITIPAVLQATWSALKAAWDLYDNVETRRRQIGVLLIRSQDLVAKIAQHLASLTGAEISTQLRAGVDELQRACEEIKAVLELLKQKGFLWCMLHQDKIDSQLREAERRIADAFEMVHFIAHLQADIMQQELRQAQTQDRDEFVALLDRLAANDERILSAVQDQGGAHRRLEDLLVAVLKHVETLDPSHPSPEANFLQSASVVLQRRSSGRPQEVSADWVVSSLDVEFDTAAAIGQGSFGRVFRAQWTGIRVAVKQMYSEDARTLSPRDRKAMYREVKLWATLHHPNILELYGACLEATLPFLVMRYCSLGDLRSFLPDHPDVNRVDLCYDIVAGMNYLHGRGIVHADLKCVNIMVDDRHVALVADFGLSHTMQSVRAGSSSTQQNSVRGTLRWMAPECLDGSPVTKESDVYSLGVTMWEVFSEQIPFIGVSDLVLARLVVERKQRPPRPARLVHDTLWTLMQECWAPESSSRPSLDAVRRRMQPLTTRLVTSDGGDHRPSSLEGTGDLGLPVSADPQVQEGAETMLEISASVIILDAKDLPKPYPPGVYPMHLLVTYSVVPDDSSYPVLKIGDFTFWAFAWSDRSRDSYAIVIYDKGVFVKVFELAGAFWVHSITLSEDGTATFIGKDGISASIPLATLYEEAHIPPVVEAPPTWTGTIRTTSLNPARR